jgi:hypothetical protein
VTGATPLPEKLSSHKLSHTFASLLVALGTDPVAAMEQLGHATPGFTLKVYAHGMRRDEASKEQLRALVEGKIVAVSGSRSDFEPPTVPIESNGHASKVGHLAGDLSYRRGGV